MLSYEIAVNVKRQIIQFGLRTHVTPYLIFKELLSSTQLKYIKFTGWCTQKCYQIGDIFIHFPRPSRLERALELREIACILIVVLGAGRSIEVRVAGLGAGNKEKAGHF